METIINYMKLNYNAQEPVCGSVDAAGHDLSAAIDKSIMIAPHQTVSIPTGISVELPQNTFGGIYARSGIARKEGLAPANKVGVVDCDYRGEVGFIGESQNGNIVKIEKGQRIAQLIIKKNEDVELVQVDELSDTERGSGGFGSTGKN